MCWREPNRRVRHLFELAMLQHNYHGRKSVSYLLGAFRSMRVTSSRMLLITKIAACRCTPESLSEMALKSTVSSIAPGCQARFDARQTRR